MRAPNDAEALVTGRERFVADLAPPGTLSMAVVRASMAHATIDAIHGLDDARALSGVVDVLTAADVRTALGAIPTIGTRIGGTVDPTPYLQPVIAADVVRYVGEPIAVIVAENRYLAEDAAALVDVDLQPLDAVVDPVTAAEHPPLFAPHANEVQTIHARLGDGAAVFDTAPVVVEADLTIGRQTGMPMETRGLLAMPDGDRLHIHGSAKVLHWNRNELARMLDVDPGRIRLVECAVGGSFGVRGEFYPEDFLVAFAASHLGVAVLWIEDRWEHFVATNHGRGQYHRAALAGTTDGTILGLRSEFWADLGAYVRTNGLRIPEITAGMLPGPYRIPNYEAIGHSVVTTTTPIGTVRGPGRVESTFVRERLIDLYAHQIGADPVEVRCRNLLGPADLPFERATFDAAPRIVIETGDPRSLLDEVVASLPSADIVARRRAQGELVGVGVAAFLERSGTGPPFELASVEIDETGQVIVRSGASSVGQGLAGALATLTAGHLGVDPAHVTVAALDTDELDAGAGSFGSRSTIMAGNAAVAAADQLVADALPVAADLLGVNVDEVHYRDGAYRAGSDAEAPLGEVAKQIWSRHPDQAHPVEATVRFADARPNSDPGVHAAVVSVDADTGHVTVERLVLGFESGPPVDLAAVHGQLRGAAAQGLGGALFEELVHDADGNPTTTSFVDYLLPTAAEMPPVDIHLDTTPSPLNPLGLRGVGEGGITGVPAAIAAAVADALGDPRRVTSTPIRPDDVHAALEAREEHPS